ncbi:MAG TPA: hypothetical protein VHE12_14235 [bacterium]|nr:hypothetical protein [bacterium]
MKNDVWSSLDGTNWTKILGSTTTGSATQFPPREDFTALVYNNLMWVIGGFDVGQSYNDVWNSADGITWNLVLANGTAGANHFSKRWGMSSAVYNNQMWLMTGAYSTIANSNPTTVYSDVWNSSTGASWTRISLSNIFYSMYYGQGVVFNNQIWLTGGYLAGWGARSITDSTTDGINWTPSSGPFDYRFYHLGLSYNNKLWIIAGCNNVCQSASCAITYLNDVWYTQ